ncbi:MAG TPA: cytochrome c [Acidimicrobiia bacterium]
MKRTAEAGLAIFVVLVIGVGLWLFADGDLGEPGTSPTVPIEEVDTEAVARGMQLATDKGCAACHTSDGTPLTGPTWKGLAGSTRPLESGETVVADTAYLFNSIVDPGSQIVEGFADVMPADYAETLTEAEINDLVAYIQSLAG